eukprot:366564-Chlamydomonas_euryale.AAC.16
MVPTSSPKGNPHFWIKFADLLLLENFKFWEQTEAFPLPYLHCVAGTRAMHHACIPDNAAGAQICTSIYIDPHRPGSMDAGCKRMRVCGAPCYPLLPGQKWQAAVRLVR